MNVAKWVLEASAMLRDARIESPQLEAQVLAAHALGKDRSWVLAHPEAPLDEGSAATLLRRRLAREPLAYIIGWREFYGRRFSVSPAVLIPRQETETLVEAFGSLRSRLKAPAPRVLDLGTGSGCLAVTLKLEWPELEVAGSDVSAAALEVARSNAEALGAQVRLIESDLFEGLVGERYDAIVTNPPYVARDAPLQPEVADHEPPIALFANEGGLKLFQRLAVEAPAMLCEGGFLLTEIGDGQEPAVQEAFEGSSCRLVSRFNDLAGTPRVLAFQAASS